MGLQRVTTKELFTMAKLFDKPQEAEDAILSKLKFPCWEQPKIDGVRAMNRNGLLIGRSMDPFEGYQISEYFGRPKFMGLDGEMTLGDDPTADRLCSITTGAMGRFKGVTSMADMHLWAFDYLTPNTIDMSYEQRYEELIKRLLILNHDRVHQVTYKVCHNMEELAAAIALNNELGYEGTIIRNPRAKFKPGRATQAEQELWRVKPWADAEIMCTGITEGHKNGNEAKTNTRGRTERSSSAAGLIPNGMVGSIQGYMLKDFNCPFTGRLLFAKDLPINIAPGKMTDKEALYYFQHPEAIVGHPLKFKHLATGVKDVPRMATYLSHRLKQDMSS